MKFTFLMILTLSWLIKFRHLTDPVDVAHRNNIALKWNLVVQTTCRLLLCKTQDRTLTKLQAAVLAVRFVSIRFFNYVIFSSWTNISILPQVNACETTSQPQNSVEVPESGRFIQFYKPIWRFAEILDWWKMQINSDFFCFVHIT